MNIYTVAAIWMALALGASLISIRAGIAVALAEILVGAVAGNIPGVSGLVQQTAFTGFLASLGSVSLTFLAGAEIDPVSLRRHWKASLSIGIASFTLPFLAAMAVCYFVLGWDLHAAEIGGVALSTTSVAVVYAVMVETGLNRADLGKLILAACFVTDLGTVLALGALFAGFNLFLVVFIVATGVALIGTSPALRWIMRTFGHRVSEPELKFLLLVLLALGGLATAAGSEAVLPAYLVGLVTAGVFQADRVLMDRMRSTAFALLTPFFFLRAGLLISAPALVGGAGVIAALFLTKMAAKLIGVWPVAAAFGVARRDRNYLTLLMATGLTFGSISALYGLNHGLVTSAQYSELITVVILSAVIPTLIAQRLFQPRKVDADEEEALGAEDASIVHRPETR
ncbi:MAG TPA: cation:proton antiporter [Candidatus Acidoferrum sp.]|jgi:Kef-type K+ transport system membrane component KefB|nr:cation:proton antiporter [Candidatus Acidoferrum sp.]